MERGGLRVPEPRGISGRLYFYIQAGDMNAMHRMALLSLKVSLRGELVLVTM